MIFWECFHCSLTQVLFCESHKGFVKSLCYAIPALTNILIPPPTHEKSKITTTRRRLVDMDHLPMMHCKFNISSSALLHQSQTISRLVWSTQWRGACVAAAGSFLLLLSHLPTGKTQISNVAKLLFLGGDPTARSRQRKVKPSWEGQTQLGRENPRQDVWEGFLSF